MDDDLNFDAATPLGTLLGELIVELVKAGSLTETQAAKILLRAESFIDALQFQKDRDVPLATHKVRMMLHRLAVGQVSEHVQKRLALQPHVSMLRHRQKRLAAEYRRRKKRSF